MKKIIILFGICLLSASAFSQTKVRMDSETVGFWNISADTMTILKTDRVVSGSVYVPSFASDSVHISGCTFTVDGIATNGITIPPGEASVNFGAKYAVMDSITIISDDISWITLLIDREN